MKRLVVVLMLLVFCVSIFGCSDTKVINGKMYDTYGLFNESTNMNPNIRYKVVIGNIVWSIILCETIFAPIYFIGFDMFEPVGVKFTTEEPGVIAIIPESK